MRFTWKANPETMALAALCAGDGAAFLSGMNPSLFTIRSFSGDWASNGETKRDIRIGMVIGNALGLGVGYAGSVVTDSWWPLFLTLGVVVVLDLAYEWALRSPRGNSE